MRILGGILWCASFLLAAGCIYALCQHENFAALGLHLAAGACGLGVSLIRPQGNHYLPFELPLALMIPAFGGFLCAFCSQRTQMTPSEGLAADYIRHIDPDEYRDPFMLTKNAFKPNPEKLQPLADILHSQAPLSTKRTAIEALAQLQSPGAVAVLRDALRMDSVEVRFFAASVLSRLEDALTQKLKELEKEKNSRDASVLLSTAQNYFDYAFFEIAEGFRRLSCLQEALKKAELALEIARTPQALSMCGKIQLELGRYPEAETLFEEYIKLRPTEATGFLWRAQARLLRGEYHLVREDCRQALELGDLPVKIREAVQYWGKE